MELIERDIQPTMLDAAMHSPIITLTGPRQSGKTTLTRRTFPSHEYVSLEPHDLRSEAVEDPRGFLDRLSDGAVIDEVQHAPDLASYLQEEVDRDPTPGRFILTGSENLAITQTISQSLAGRTAILHLLPLSLAEIRRFNDAPAGLLETMLRGGFPRIHATGVPADRWLADYTATYVERDVRSIRDIGNLQTFSTFLRLCAGRTAAPVNLSSIGGDAGVSHNTARSWLSVLEGTYLATQLPAFARSHRKQLTKAPKLHLLDSGLICHLLGITTTEHLRTHPLRGAVFESWVAAELLKSARNRGDTPRLHHFRDARGVEVDLIDDQPDALRAIEVKSAATFSRSFLGPLSKLAESIDAEVARTVVYGGDRTYRTSGTDITSWQDLASLTD